MATITKRGSGWFVQVRRKGYAGQYKTTRTKVEALAWAREREAQLDSSPGLINSKRSATITLGDLVRRYVAEVTPMKRGSAAERARLMKLVQRPVCEISVRDLSSGPIAAYRDARLQEVKPATVRRELATLRHALDVAEREWGIIHRQPFKKLRLPREQNARDRRLREGDLNRLEASLELTRSTYLGPIILFALETALRRGELLRLEWCDVDLPGRVAAIQVTKTGIPRTIPLTPTAITILEGLGRSGARVFPVSAEAVRHAWERTRKRAGLTDLRFHDLRHEAISRFCELGLSIPEVSVISGHRDPRMLFRYAHLRPADLALKLAKLT